MQMRWLFASLIFAAACGSSGKDSLPAPNRPYEPGSVHSNPYGSGSGGGAIDPGSRNVPEEVCPEPSRQCATEFAYKGPADAKSVDLRGSYRSDAWAKGDPMAWDAASQSWRVTVPIPWNTRVEYKFHYVDKNNAEHWVPDGDNSVYAPATCATFTCDAPACDFTAAPGTYDWRDAVMYFVFVDRFLNGDVTNDRPISAPGLMTPANWNGGDWAGVRQKIREGYFTSLGVNTLWISVPLDNSDHSGIGDDGQIYSAYHGYWPRDLDKPESRFGTTAELKALVDEAHAAGLRVIADYAMNHVHQDSPVYQAHTNDGWFNPLKQNGQNCVCGEGLCSDWDGPYGKVCWFRDYLPDFNFANADARKFSVDNALSWIKSYQFDGFRLDAIKHVDLRWLTDLRTRLISEVEPTSKQHVYLVGETFTGDRGLLKKYVDQCRMLDGQFDFALRGQLDTAVLMRRGKMKDLADFMDSNAAYYGTGVMSTFLGNHDVPRSIHFADDNPLWDDVWKNGKDRNWSNTPGVVAGTSAYERVALAWTILMTNRGVPLMYYGDEIGLPGAGDPDNRRPMQWSGYATGQSLLLDRVKKAGAVRAQHSALRRGQRTTLSIDTDTWAYQMVDGTDRVVVAINRSDAAKAVAGIPAGHYTDALTGDVVDGGSAITVAPRSARVLIP